MPLAYRNHSNAELKRFLKKHSITYYMIADKAHYNYGTIAHWMLTELTSNHKAIIYDAIGKVLTEQGIKCHIPGSD